jgi:hypothetical protein
MIPPKLFGKIKILLCRVSISGGVIGCASAPSKQVGSLLIDGQLKVSRDGCPTGTDKPLELIHAQ